MTIQRLNIPDKWKHYFSEYPNGYTLLEAIIEWTNKVNIMIDDLNLTNEALEKFWLETLPENLEIILNQWYEDGTLADLINLQLLEKKADKEMVEAVIADLDEALLDILQVKNEISDLAVNIKTLGAKGNGVNDDTAIFENAFNNYKKILIPSGTYIIKRPINVDQNDSFIQFDKDAKIKNDSPTFDDRVLNVNGDNITVDLGTIEIMNRKKFVVSIFGKNNKLLNGTIFFRTKSTMQPIPSSSIYYNQGGIELAGNNNTVENVEVYNMEGAGLCLYDDGNTVSKCNLHDNCTGLIFQTPTNAKVLNSNISKNDVRTAEGFSGALGWVHGLLFDGNTVNENGEHGTYIKGTNVTISNNYLKNGNKNGIKVSDIDGCIISGNKLESNNFGGALSEAQIYCQNSFKNVIVENNIEISHETPHFIRAYSKETTTKNFKFLNNVVKSKVLIHVVDGMVVSGNTSDDVINLGINDASYPKIKNVIATGNKVQGLEISQCEGAIVENNIMEYLYYGLTSNISAINNTMTKQASDIRIDGVKKFNGNDINCTMTTGSLIKTLAYKVHDLEFKDNIFQSAGARFLYMTTTGVSGDRMTISGNTFKGSLQPLYFWGNNHIIVNNRSDQSMGYLGCNNSIIMGNIGGPSLRADTTGNVVANNIKI